MKIESSSQMIPDAARPVPARQETAGGFGAMLKEAFTTVNRQQQEADQAVEGLANGRQSDIHGTMIALEKANTSFQLLMQVRNKVVSAYETVMRTQV
jgi:flagellar hook-basal body complex protein FliE